MCVHERGRESFHTGEAQGNKHEYKMHEDGSSKCTILIINQCLKFSRWNTVFCMWGSFFALFKTSISVLLISFIAQRSGWTPCRARSLCCKSSQCLGFGGFVCL